MSKKDPEAYITLGGVCSKIGSGATPRGGKSVYIEDGISLIRSQNVINLYFSYDGLAHITDEAGQKLKGVTIEEDDVLLNITGDSVARCCMVANDVLPARVNQHVCIIRPDKKVLNPTYLMYYLNTSHIQQYLLLLAMGKGASRNAITKEMVEKFTIERVPIEQQNRIDEILSQYDKAIAINKKRIDILDNIAHEIYQEWFVRFRYPGHEKSKFKKSKIGRIPEQFEELKMEDIFDYYIGGGWGNEDQDKDFSQESYVIRGADFPSVAKGDVTSCPLRYHKVSNYEKRVLKNNDIILEVSGGTAEQPVGRTILVDDDILDRLDRRVICASFCKLVRLKDIINPYYFYYWMQFLYDTRIIDRFQLQSTGIINFKFEYFLHKGDVLMPPMELMQQFEDAVKPLHDEKHLLARKNDNLIKQRDMLIPRLMSGKLKA